MVTVAPLTKFAPLIVTEVPPAVVPEVGLIPLTEGAGNGAAAYVNPFVFVPASPPGLVTVMLTAPLECAGVVAVIVVLPTTVTFVAAELPKLTLAPEAKPVPDIVTEVPPAAAPLAGETPLTTGAVFGTPEKNSDMLLAVAAAPG